MPYNLISNIEYCAAYVSDIRDLLIYSHIPTTLAVLILVFFVYIRNRTLLVSKLLISIGLVFSLWTGLNVTIWFSYAHADILMFAWSLIEILGAILFFLAFYFTYSYINKDSDFSLLWKFFLILPLAPVVFFSSTFFLVGYDPQECIAIENTFYSNYVNFVRLSYALLTLGYMVIAFFKQENSLRRWEIVTLGAGISAFLYAFLFSGYISSVTENFTYEFYGIFFMIIFMGSLAYLIVTKSLFNLKLIAAQALVTILGLLVAAQLSFIRSTPDFIISLTTVFLVVFFGYFLIRSVKAEIQARERNETLAKDLAHANNRLRELDKQKSEFVSIASHQLRSPLTSIRGYASMLLEGSYGKVPQKAQDIIERIQESSAYMALSIEDFLNVSRIEQGRMKYENTYVDIKTMVERVVDEIRPTALKKGLVLLFRSDCTSKTIACADPGKTRQIIYNLVDNSLKYTPKGSVDVTVRDDIVFKKIYVSIKDTGVGIDEEGMKEVFEKFVRAKNANDVNVSGSGLGLYVAKQMAEAMQGKILVESEGLKKGSTFTLELPLVE